MPFEILDVVRVAQLLIPSRDVDGSAADPPQPRVGDTGIIVEVVGDDVYLVERTTDDGRLLWTAEFSESELKLLDRPAD